MTQPVDALLAHPHGLYRFLYRALSLVRWATLVIVLLLTFMQPRGARIGSPTWLLVLGFAAYNLLAAVLLRRQSKLRALVVLALVDLPLAALLYVLGGDPGGPLFVLFFLAVDSAAASMTLRGTLVYTATAAAVAGATEVTLPQWMGSLEDARRLGVRLVTLGLVGVGMAIVTRRLTLEHEAARRVQTEADRLEALEQLRGELIASVSHDLRTPLTAARAAVVLAQTSAQPRLQPQEVALLDNGRRNIERLSLLIDDLLTFNQLEAGALPLDREWLDLRDIVTNAVAAVQPLVMEKGQRLDVDLPEPLAVVGDRRQLEQVVVNLLANAHRHTPMGTHIALSGRVHAGKVHLAVHDTGPGIPAEELEGIFGRFRRGDAAAGGSGLGLAIAKGIVELHGGRIWAESEPGRGATFHILLPQPATEDGV